MGNSEEGKPAVSEKSSSPPPASIQMDKNNVHMYPDWATMQGFYGPQISLPPHLKLAAAPHPAPIPYMWCPPQSMMPPYGSPYAAFYPHGGVFAHPGIPLAGTALNVEMPAKSSGNGNGGFVKKLKEFDGLAITIGNGNGNSAGHESEHQQSDSEETEGSSDGSNGVTTAVAQNGKKRSRQGSPGRGDEKVLKEGDRASEKITDVPPAYLKAMENTNSKLELKDHPSLSLKSSPTNIINSPQPSLPNESWVQNDRELKRERRKQSNRESARRSRLRKQAETEELAAKVQALTAENMALSSKINKLMESSEKLKLENAALTDKLRGAQVEQVDDDLRLNPVGTANLLARVNNNDSKDVRNDNDDDSSFGNKSSARGKLRQLLDANPRTDTVAAG